MMIKDELFANFDVMGELSNRGYGIKLQLDGATVYCCTARKTNENFIRAFDALMVLFGDDPPTDDYLRKYLEIATYTIKGATA